MIRHTTEHDVTENYSPALCELIYRAHRRERLRDQLVGLDLSAAAATNSGFVTNSRDIIRGAREEIESFLTKPLLPE